LTNSGGRGRRTRPPRFNASPLSVISANRNLDIGVLAVERSAALVFRVHDPLDSRKIAPAQRIVLMAEQTLPSSPALDGLDPDVHHLAAYEGFDPLGSVPREKPQP